MNFRVLKILFTFLGGLLFWALKGFKSKLKNELTDSFLYRNLSVSILVFIVIYTVCIVHDQEDRSFTSGEDVKASFEKIIKKIESDTIINAQKTPVIPADPY